LSSGEQHFFVLFFRLIFIDSNQNKLVLIDEPELSLHPRWQVRFIDDLERIREIASIDFILASHSPLIFQGHIDLGRDLNV
jgi:predicted ATP-dependent endonuclease of OLD family